MPFDLLALHPPRRPVHFQDSLAERVSKKQHKYKAYADKRRRAKQSHLGPGVMVHVQIQSRHSKLDPVFTPPQKFVSKPSEHTVRLEDGNTWNAEKLMKSSTAHVEQPQKSTQVSNQLVSGGQTGRATATT